MLANIIKKLIAFGRTDELSEKLDVFYAAGKLNAKEYGELTAALAERAPDKFEE